MNKFNNIVELYFAIFIEDSEKDSRAVLDPISLEHVWDLGVLIKKEIENDSNNMFVEEIILQKMVPEICSKTDRSEITVARNLRVSYKVVKFFPRKQEWLQVMPSIGTFHKLKLIESLLDPNFRKKYSIPEKEFNNLMSSIKDLSHDKLGEATKKIMSEYVKRSIPNPTIDIESIWQNCYNINTILKEVIDKDDRYFIKDFRKMDKAKIEDLRLLFSMIKNEKVFETHKYRFKSFNLNFKQRSGNIELVNDFSEFRDNLNQLLQELMKIEKTKIDQREDIRFKIPISLIGQISTRLKALSEDKELERYKLNENILYKVQAILR